MSTIRSRVLTVTGMSATNALSRAAFVGGLPAHGQMNSLELSFTSIAGGAANVAQLTLTWVNADNRHIVMPATPAAGLPAIYVDTGDATKGSIEVDVTREFNGVPADATGVYLGIKLDAGTATVDAYLHVRGHA